MKFDVSNQVNELKVSGGNDIDNKNYLLNSTVYQTLCLNIKNFDNLNLIKN